MMKRYQWWSYAVRAAGIIATTIWCTSAFILLRLLKRRTSSAYTVVIQWARSVLKWVGVQLDVRGIEHLRSQGKYIFVANHCSLLDVPILIVASPLPVRFLYKRELNRVPFLGWAMMMSSFIAVERERIHSAGRVLATIRESLEQDSSPLVIFPEGTRSPTGELGHFRRGAFVVAFAARRDLVPVVIRGTHRLLPPGGLRFSGGPVSVEFLPPVQPPEQSMTRVQEREWIERLRTRIAEVMIQ